MERLGRVAAHAFVLLAAMTAAAVAEPVPPRDTIPLDISPQAHAIFEKMLPGVIARRKDLTLPHTPAEFDARNAAIVTRAEAGVAPLIKALGVTDDYLQMGGVGVLKTTPPQFKDDGTILIRVHGGGFIQGSARSDAGLDAQIAVATGRRILSVDYTVAPHGNWRRVTDQVIAVYKAVLAQGYQPKSVGMFGDSAGGNIVPASVLKMRDEGVPMPGAVVLLSPCVDFTLNGDTEKTLRDADPALWNQDDITNGMKAYADPRDWKNPYVSPIYGDFTKGFPPVLLQVGTREILLSDSVRLYRAIEGAGGDAKLDVYEGMTHVFQSYMVGTPEQSEAFNEMQRFWLKHLTPSAATH